MADDSMDFPLMALACDLKCRTCDCGFQEWRDRSTASLAAKEAQIEAKDRALMRLASMEAFEGPRAISNHPADVELLARIRYAERALSQSPADLLARRQAVKGKLEAAEAQITTCWALHQSMRQLGVIRELIREALAALAEQEAKGDDRAVDP